VTDDLKDMLLISNSVGSDPRLVQGGGGNTSVKTDGGRLMYVKASGTGLRDMREGAGYRLVDVAGCISIIEDNRIGALPQAEREAEVVQRLMECCVDELKGRPSVETSLHAMLDRCVVHTHPSIVNGLLCAGQGREALAKLFADLAPPYLYIEYAGAGYTLARKMHAELREYKAKRGVLPEVIFLENHGLFISTGDAERALALTRQVSDAIGRLVREATGKAELPPFAPLDKGHEENVVAEVAAAMRRFYSKVLGRPAVVCFESDETVRHFLRTPRADELCAVPPLVPDEVVYCRDHPIWVSLPSQPGAIQEQVAAALTAHDAGVHTPLCVLVEGVGLFCAAPSPNLLDAVSGTMRAVLETLSIAAYFGGARGLSSDSLEFLRNWEVERFRRHTATGEASQDASREDLAGRVALVTGAGSGLGRGISLGLARKGVHVVLADIDLHGSRETARRMREQGSTGRGYPVDADVTSEDSVRGLLSSAIRAVGGVDILVNCAGIAPIHRLVDFPLPDWQKALAVNLTGYFLVAREAARCMVRQGTGGSIINISSKTGLQASENHSAYNATKAGEIHLARGWALELAAHGIRVNSICPGNVFTESQIWNQDYVKAIAAKRGIQPEEVIPYYISLTALKKEITWDDVSDAVAFLAGPAASKITGQTLVVDAGQVFVR